MIQSIFVYGFMIANFWFLGSSAGRKQVCNPKVKFWSREIWIIIVIFSVFCGLRNMVGVDWYQYKEEYLSPTNDPSLQREWLFTQFSLFLSGLGAHYAIYFAFIAFVQIFFLLYAFKDERFIYPFLLFVFMTNGTFYMWMNGIRQCIVLSIFIFATKYINKRDPIRYYFAIIISLFIHKSAILLVPFYLSIFTKDIFKNKVIQLGLLAAALFLTDTGFWKEYMDWIGSAGELLKLGESSSAIEARFLIYDDIHYSHGFRYYATVVIGMICILLGDKVKQKYNLYLWYNLFFIGLISYVLFFSAPLLTRVTTYFIYSQFVLIAYTLYYLYSNRRSLNFLAFWGIIAILFMFWFVEISSNFYTQYYFIWQRPGRMSI